MDKATLKEFKEKQTIYLVGDEESVKLNSWWAITNDAEQVEPLMKELGGTKYKKVYVQPKGDS